MFIDSSRKCKQGEGHRFFVSSGWTELQSRKHTLPSSGTKSRLLIN
jgi:hypothetical protein